MMYLSETHVNIICVILKNICHDQIHIIRTSSFLKKVVLDDVVMELQHGSLPLYYNPVPWMMI